MLPCRGRGSGSGGYALGAIRKTEPASVLSSATMYVSRLQVGRLLEALRERNGEQEREQHLDAGERHPQLIEELDQLPVDALLVCLLRHRGGE